MNPNLPLVKRKVRRRCHVNRLLWVRITSFLTRGFVSLYRYRDYESMRHPTHDTIDICIYVCVCVKHPREFFIN